MDFSRIPLLTMLTKKMGWLQQRQVVLSQNVANSDTPDYQARDLKPFDFQKELAGVHDRMAPRRTSAMHLASDAGTSGSGGRRVEKAPEKYESSPQGNSVVLEEEMLKIGDAQMDHTMTANLYRKQIGLLKMALGDKR